MPIAIIRPGGGLQHLATGMWTSVSGASAQAQNVDLIANNLANVDTTAFKKDVPTFKEYLALIEREREPTDIPRGPIKDKDFYPLDGRDQSFVVMDGTYTNFKPGSFRVTHSPLDLAIDGPGFLEVNTPSGLRYTKQGSLKVATDGKLVSLEGHPVLAFQSGGLAGGLGELATGQSTTPVQGLEVARFINLRDRGNITITPAGEIFSGDELVAKLSIAEFQDLKKLKKSGGQLFENLDSRNFSSAPIRSQIKQGVLETSNVNPIEEMTHLIKANRQFEQSLKAMKTYGDLLGREANDLGKL